MEGIKKLEKQMLEMDDYNVTGIFNYLQTRTDLDEYYKNEEKTMQGAYDYVCSKAENKKKNNVAMIASNMVYLWTIAYFTKSNKELGIKEKNEPKANNNKVAKEEEQATKASETPSKSNYNQISMFKEVQS